MIKGWIGRSQLKKWNFKTILKEILIVMVLMFILSNIMSTLRKPDLASSELPQIEVQLLDGSIFSMEEGKPLILHFWATWCPTCKLEASNIESVSKEYNVLTIAVSSGNDTQLKSYIKKYGLGFSVLNDRDGSWAKRFNVEVFPTTFIYDAKGELRFTEVGYTTTAGLLARLKWIK